MNIKDRLNRWGTSASIWMQKHKAISGVIVGLAVLLIVIAILALFPQGGIFPGWLSTKPDIQASDSLEVGETINIEAKSTMSPDTYYFRWGSSNPQVGTIAGEGKKVTFTGKAPGETVITLEVDGRANQKILTVYPRAYIDVGMPEAWVTTGSDYPVTVSKAEGVEITETYVTDANRKKLDDEDFFKSIADKSVLNLKEDVTPGNYILTIEGIAKSNGRTIKVDTPFTALTEIARGYYTFTLTDQNLISITPWQYSAIENYISTKLGIDNVDLTNVKSQGDIIKSNSFSSKYVFYRDPSRGDALCYENDVKVQGSKEDAKTFYQITTRANNGNMWKIATDGIIILVYPAGSSFEYYLDSVAASMATNINPSATTTIPVSGTSTTSGNNNPNSGQTNIPSPKPPIM
ncbi:MAG: hypothetical protein PHY30_01820 [Candidatus Pacebacteria bacterium]|nr:hypothetical protein [Candidatus Paceibacterota bacterium]